MSMFLDEKELAQLTGKKAKGKQIEALRKMAVPFRVNATGHAIVTRAAVEGFKEESKPAQGWTPRVLRTA